MIAKYRFDVFTAAIPTTYPNNFWRKPKQYAEITEVCVFGYDHETLAPRLLAHFFVRN